MSLEIKSKTKLIFDELKENPYAAKPIGITLSEDVYKLFLEK